MIGIDQRDASLAPQGSADPARRSAELAPLPDEALVARARSGDRLALDALLGRHAMRLAEFASRHAPPSEGPDVAQAALVRAVEALGDLVDPARFRGWLYGIALNEARRRHRRLGRLRAALVRWVEGRPAAHEPESSDDERELVRAAVAALPERQRLAVELRIWEGLSCEEAATALGCTVGTIKASFHHGITKLRDRLAREARRGERGADPGKERDS